MVPKKKKLESPDPQRDGTWKGMIHMGRIAKLDDDHALMLIGSNGNYPRIGVEFINENPNFICFLAPQNSPPYRKKYVSDI